MMMHWTLLWTSYPRYWPGPSMVRDVRWVNHQHLYRSTIRYSFSSVLRYLWPIMGGLTMPRDPIKRSFFHSASWFRTGSRCFARDPVRIWLRALEKDDWFYASSLCSRVLSCSYLRELLRAYISVIKLCLSITLVSRLLLKFRPQFGFHSPTQL